MAASVSALFVILSELMFWYALQASNLAYTSSLKGIQTLQYLYEPEQYRIYRKYSDRQAWANSVDPELMPQNAASDQGLHCSPLIQ